MGYPRVGLEVWMRRVIGCGISVLALFGGLGLGACSANQSAGDVAVDIKGREGSAQDARVDEWASDSAGEDWAGPDSGVDGGPDGGVDAEGAEPEVTVHKPVPIPGNLETATFALG